MSEQRIVLKEAIAAHKAAQATLAAAEGGADPLSRAVWSARSALEAAQERLQAAKASAGDYVLADVLGGAEAAERPLSLREARDAVRDAEDRLEDATVARDALKERMPALKSAVDRAHDRLLAARRAVVRSETRETVDAKATELKRQHEQVSRTAVVLRWLADAGAVPLVEEHGGSFGRVADVDLRRLLDKHALSSFQGIAEPWRAWSEALLTDASAPMPETSK